MKLRPMASAPQNKPILVLGICDTEIGGVRDYKEYAVVEFDGTNYYVQACSTYYARMLNCEGWYPLKDV